MIPFIDLKKQYGRIEDKIRLGLDSVLDHGAYIMGPEIQEFENRLCEYVGCKHSLAVSSGTDALLLSLMALEIGPGDEVIVPDFSFFATAEVISLLGASPVFVDVDPDTYNLDPNLIEEKITSKTKAIMPVSLYGQCAELTKINEIACKHEVIVIEDSAQSFGAEINGIKSGNLSGLSGTSFFPSKPLGGYGDGGAIFTNISDYYEALVELRNHGQSGRYVHTRIGINGRMDSFQAAVLMAKLDIFDEERDLRDEVANRYHEGLKDIVKIQSIRDGYRSVYAQYTIEVDNRDQFQKKMQEKGVPTAIHYPQVMSKQPVYGEKYKDIHNPKADQAAERVISIPMHPYLSVEDQTKVIEAVKSSL